MLAKLRQWFIDKIYTPLGNKYFFHWPSGMTEAVGAVTLFVVALLVALLLELLVHHFAGLWFPWWAFLAVAFLVAQDVSYLYEKYVDPNGWDLEDFLVRAVGITIAFVLLLLIIL